MEILIRPSKFVGQNYWHKKMNGVILVQNEEDIEPLWKLLCEQDDYWDNYKHIIKVSPKEIDSVSDISRMCEYCGKTDIYDVEEIRSKIPFIIHQEYALF